MGGQGTLICAQTSDGKVVWQKSMTADLGGKRQDWGYTESVLIAGNTEICTPGGPDGTLAALDKKSGAVVWRTKELTDNAQYSSPILVQHAGKESRLTNGDPTENHSVKFIKGVDGAIGAKTVTYDFHRMMEGATLRKCSEFGDDVIAHM